jgi:hypothetical protein
MKDIILETVGRWLPTFVVSIVMAVCALGVALIP